MFLLWAISNNSLGNSLFNKRESTSGLCCILCMKIFFSSSKKGGTTILILYGLDLLPFTLACILLPVIFTEVTAPLLA